MACCPPRTGCPPRTSRPPRASRQPRASRPPRPCRRHPSPCRRPSPCRPPTTGCRPKTWQGPGSWARPATAAAHPPKPWWRPGSWTGPCSSPRRHSPTACRRSGTSTGPWCPRASTTSLPALWRCPGGQQFGRLAAGVAAVALRLRGGHCACRHLAAGAVARRRQEPACRWGRPWPPDRPPLPVAAAAPPPPLGRRAAAAQAEASWPRRPGPRPCGYGP
mmetsp:Transcript_54934/g.172334  ORF Transcript_54934/g.172334 Transcript_54934/m.172334 type:complete len:219 (+) Transcript_54934:967-1623(+)